MTNKNLLLWVDIETTGLDETKDKIIQIAYVLTDFELNMFHIFPELTIMCDNDILENMDEWCKVHHNKSGLTDKCKKSSTSLSDAELTIINNLNQYISIQDRLIIAGNSVHFDKRFIDYHMPLLSKRLTHKIYDISSFGLLFKNLNLLKESEIYKKKYNHTAQDDILESIYEYRSYLKRITDCIN